MKNISLLLLLISSLLIVSCQKKGCIDTDALNYTTGAKKDDGTCTYPTKVKITAAKLKNFPNVDGFGYSWDNGSTADPFLSIENIALDILHQTSAKIDESAEMSWDINPELTITESSFSSNLIIYVYDDDGSTDEIMGEIWIDLNDYTSNGTKTNKYPSTIQHSAQGCTVEFDLTWE
jgi:hypothetical protein